MDAVMDNGLQFPRPRRKGRLPGMQSVRGRRGLELMRWERSFQRKRARDSPGNGGSHANGAEVPRGTPHLSPWSFHGHEKDPEKSTYA
ncbi:hypothetical protein CDAR_30381 [Caerostris darwini]|uniref:Uncharacterized protein n=1 Tax=Caerostris darwini TaxID=1538125 RepID=A0AAV4VWA8_9ARAC|nr:hypothetical protein CDAR_30381 [Caerostris darwini]